MEKELYLVCIGCGRTPEELIEYNPISTGEDLTAREYVLQEEGTLNMTNGHFTCDGCYIAMGMPTAPRGWVAP